MRNIEHLNGSCTQSCSDLEAALIELAANVRGSLAKLNGPLRNAIRESLHDPNILPEVKCSQLAAEAVDVLHQAQILIEPTVSILADYFLGYTNSKCLNAAVEHDIPDILGSKPATLEQLARASRTQPNRLLQILRTLCNNGIFEYNEVTRLYKNNDASTLLRKDHPSQWRNWIELYGNQFYDIARGIPGSISNEARRSAAQINYDTDLDMFHYFEKQGWTPLLHKTLGAGAAAMAPGILNDYPWAEIADSSTVILDIGGGGGGLITTLLRHFKHLRGGIFDLPHVIEHAKSLFHGENGTYADLSDRVPPENLIGGDFFESVPSFEIYTMKWVLHDWDDDKSRAILRNIRSAIKTGPKSRLIIMETILSDGHSSRLSRYADINMMMTAKGQERTEVEWRELAYQSGWDVRAIYSLRNAWFKAIELVPRHGDYVSSRRHWNELRRLETHHEWIKHAMGGELLHCPVNHRQPTLRVLDWGAADGHWLADMASRLPVTAVLVGVNPLEHLLPSLSTLPKNIQFIQQSTHDPWPRDFQSSFDVVHQRMGLAKYDLEDAQTVVSGLFSLVKPGGWIQILERDYSKGFTGAQRTIYPATAKFADLVLTAKPKQHAPRVKRCLQAAGALDIVETFMELPVGHHGSLTPDLQAGTARAFLSDATEFMESRDADFDMFYNDIAEEVVSRGGLQRLRLVYGRRPNMD